VHSYPLDVVGRVIRDGKLTVQYRKPIPAANSIEWTIRFRLVWVTSGKAQTEQFTSGLPL